MKIIALVLILVCLLLGCAGGGADFKSTSVLSDAQVASLNSGSVTLTCGLACSGAWGSNRKKMKTLHDTQSWGGLANIVLSIGYNNDLAYYYLGRSAEGMGLLDVAKIYYQKGTASRPCDGLINVCDGFVIPKELEQRISHLSRSSGLVSIDKKNIALLDPELNKLRAETDDAKRKQAEAEERQRIQAQQATQTQRELEEQLKLAQSKLSQTKISVAPQPARWPAVAIRRALVIGNDTYRLVPKLSNAREDAKTIAENLTLFGYQVTLKFDLSEKEMKATLRNFSAQVQGGDEVLFFFAGHGVQLGAANYLLPTDIAGDTEAQVRDEAIQLQRVLEDMSERKAKLTLVMIDACRDNPFKTSGRAIGGRGLAPTTAATGQMVIFSAGVGQQALDRLGSTDKVKNGLFTRVFVEQMKITGIPITNVMRNVRNEVARLAKTVGYEQVPAMYDQVLGDFYFSN